MEYPAIAVMKTIGLDAWSVDYMVTIIMPTKLSSAFRNKHDLESQTEAAG
jgi:hypothetical protein